MPSEREILAAEIERQLALRDCPEHHTADLYLTPSKWRIVIAALRTQDREDGAREMRERAAALCDEAAAYFDRTTGHYDRSQAAGSYRATARNTRALPLSAVRTEDGDA